MEGLKTTSIPKFSRSISTPSKFDELASVQLALGQNLKKLINWFQVWRVWQKRIFLCNLVENCTTGQLDLLATALEPIFHIDFTTVFPICTRATDADSALNYQHSLVRQITQQSLKEFYDTHPLMLDSVSSTDNATTSGGSIHLTTDVHSPICAAAKFKILSLVDGEDTLLPLQLPQLHKRHRVSLGSSDFASEDFYSFERRNWHSLQSGRRKHHFKSKSVDNQVLIKPLASHLTEQFKEQLSAVSKWLVEWNEHQVSRIIFQVVKMCDSELLVYLAQCLFQKLKAIPPIDRLPDKMLLIILQHLDMTSLCRASQVCSRWKRLCNHSGLWAGQYKLLRPKDQCSVEKSMNYSYDWKQACRELFLTRSAVVASKDDAEDPDQNETDSSVQPHLTSAAVKMQMTLRSMIELVRGKCSLDDMATTQDVFQHAPESAAAVRRRLRDEKRVEAEQKGAEMCAQDSSLIFDQLATNKSSFMELGSILEIEERNSKFERKARTRLYPQANPYSLVAVAADIRSALLSMESDRNGLQAIKLAGCVFQEDVVPQAGVVEPLPLVKRILTESGAILCLQWDVRKVVIGAADQTVQINDIRSGRHVATLMGHKGGVHCLQFDHNIIVTGSWDKTCMVWDVVHFNVIAELQGHSECVSCLKFDGTTLITGSHDCTIRVWNLASFSCTNTINAHQGPITCLDFSDTILLTGSADKYVKAWSCVSYLQLGAMSHRHPVTAVMVTNLLCISGTCEGTVTFWNLESFSKLFKCRLADDPYVSSLSLSATQCYAAGTNGLLYEIDLLSTKCTRKLKGHSAAINEVQAGANRIVTVSDDQTICIWYKKAAVLSQPSDVELHTTLPVQVFQP